MRLRENEIVLFQGDSITDGNRGRNLDPNHVMGHGYQFIVGARLHADNLDRHIQTFNRGVSGNRVADLYGRWLEDTINLRPTLLSILIGVNDAWFDWSSNSGSNPARFEKIYRLLLDEALESCPSLRLVLMEPFTGGWFEDETRGRFMRERVGALASRSCARWLGKTGRRSCRFRQCLTNTRASFRRRSSSGTVCIPRSPDMN